MDYRSCNQIEVDVKNVHERMVWKDGDKVWNLGIFSIGTWRKYAIISVDKIAVNLGQMEV